MTIEQIAQQFWTRNSELKKTLTTPNSTLRTDRANSLKPRTLFKSEEDSTDDLDSITFLSDGEEDANETRTRTASAVNSKPKKTTDDSDDDSLSTDYSTAYPSLTVNNLLNGGTLTPPPLSPKEEPSPSPAVLVERTPGKNSAHSDGIPPFLKVRELEGGSSLIKKYKLQENSVINEKKEFIRYVLAALAQKTILYQKHIKNLLIVLENPNKNTIDLAVHIYALELAMNESGLIESDQKLILSYFLFVFLKESSARNLYLQNINNEDDTVALKDEYYNHDDKNELDTQQESFLQRIYLTYIKPKIIEKEITYYLQEIDKLSNDSDFSEHEQIQIKTAKSNIEKLIDNNKKLLILKSVCGFLQEYKNCKEKHQELASKMLKSLTKSMAELQRTLDRNLHKDDSCYIALAKILSFVNPTSQIAAPEIMGQDRSTTAEESIDNLITNNKLLTKDQLRALNNLNSELKKLLKYDQNRIKITQATIILINEYKNATSTADFTWKTFLPNVKRYEESLTYNLSPKAKIIKAACIFAGIILGTLIGFAVGVTVGALIGGGAGTVVPLWGNIGGAIGGGSLGGVIGAIKGAGLGASIGAIAGMTLLSIGGGAVSNTLAKNALTPPHIKAAKELTRSLHPA